MRAFRARGTSAAPSRPLYPRSRSPPSVLHREGEGPTLKVRLLGPQGPASVRAVDETLCFVLAVVPGKGHLRRQVRMPLDCITEGPPVQGHQGSSRDNTVSTTLQAEERVQKP